MHSLPTKSRSWIATSRWSPAPSHTTTKATGGGSCIRASTLLRPHPPAAVGDEWAIAERDAGRVGADPYCGPMSAVEVLGQVRLFRHLNGDDLEELAAGAEHRSYDTGAMVFREGDEADSLFAVLSGRVRIDRWHGGDSEIELLTLGPGGSFGEPALLDPARRTASVTTIEPTRLLVISRGPFLELLSRSPQALSEILAGLSSELRGIHDTVFWEVLERHALRADMEAERYRSLAQMVAGVAHEVNTPLGVINTAASVLADELVQLQPVAGAAASPALELALEAAELIRGNVARANTLVQSFKSLSVSQAVDIVEAVDLPALVQEILALYAPQARASRLRIDHRDQRGDREAPWVGNAGHLSQVLLNLLTNAECHAYTPGEGGRVEIVLDEHATPGWLELTVRDFGRGIPRGDLAKVLEPFFTTGRARGGSGLGLAIVHSLVTTGMGGNVEIESDPGAGTSVRISLPGAPSAHASEADR